MCRSQILIDGVADVSRSFFLLSFAVSSSSSALKYRTCRDRDFIPTPSSAPPTLSQALDLCMPGVLPSLSLYGGLSQSWYYPLLRHVLISLASS